MRGRRWPIFGVVVMAGCIVAMSASVHTYSGFVAFPSGGVIGVGWDGGVLYAANLGDDEARGQPVMARFCKLPPDVWESRMGRLLVGYPDSDNVRRIGDFAAASWNTKQSRTTLPDRSHWISFPLWCPLVVVASYVLLRVIWIVRGPRAGFCPSCGYDLRGSSGVCPECGTPFKNDVLISRTVVE